RRCRKAGADIDLPHLLKRRVVVGGDRAIQQRQEDEPTTGCKRAAVVWIAKRDGLLDVAGEWIDGREIAFVALRRAVAAARAGEPALILAALGKLPVAGDILTGGHGRNVEELGLRAVGRRPVVVAAGAVGA